MTWAKDSSIWVDALDKARQEIGDELLALNLENARLAGAELNDRIINGDHKLVMSRDSDGKYHHIARVPMGGKELAVVNGIQQDKANVAMGKPTSIRITTDPQANVLKLLEQMSDNYHKGIVSEQ